MDGRHTFRIQDEMTSFQTSYCSLKGIIRENDPMFQTSYCSLKGIIRENVDIVSTDLPPVPLLTGRPW